MTAVVTLITDALYASGVYGQDQTISSGDQQLVVRRLNRLLDSWSNEKNMIYLNDSEQFSMTAGQQSYSTSLLSSRPVSINSMRVSLNNIDYSVDFIDQLAWNDIGYKNVPAIPTMCYYDDAFPNANMFFFPVPYANFTCTLYCQRLLTGALTLTSDIAMPAGYEAAIVAGLAVDICPTFGKQASPQLIADMKQTRAVLMRTNFSPLEMVTPYDKSDNYSNSFIYRGF